VIRKLVAVLVLSAGCATVAAPAVGASGDVAKAFADLEREQSAGEPGTWTTYASGAAAGLRWANSLLEARKEARLYCPPRGTAQNPAKDAEIALSEYKGNQPRYDSLEKHAAEAVALAAVNGLIARFPCR
jgi:hypothetical protein